MAAHQLAKKTMACNSLATSENINVEAGNEVTGKLTVLNRLVRLSILSCSSVQGSQSSCRNLLADFGVNEEA